MLSEQDVGVAGPIRRAEWEEEWPAYWQCPDGRAASGSGLEGQYSPGFIGRQPHAL